MTERDLEMALRAALAAEGEESGALSPDELQKLRTGELSDGEREDLLERASMSADAAGALLDAVRFPEIEAVDDADRVTEADLDRLWTGFRERLEKESKPASRVRDGRPVLSIWSVFGTLRFAQAAAMILLLLCLGLAWRLFNQPQPAPARPGLNVRILELVPEKESAQRTEAPMLRESGSGSGVLLVLTLRDRGSYPAYEVIIEDSAGAAVWGSRALERAPEGFFTLALPRGFLTAGDYRIVLRGEVEGRREQLAVYPLTIDE